MKLVATSIFVILASSCAIQSSPTLLNENGASIENSSILTSECDSKCSKLVDSFIPSKRGLLDFSILPAKLHVINGQKGNKNNTCLDCAVGKSFPYFNSTWDMSYHVAVNPGQNEIVVGCNNARYPKIEPKKLVLNLEKRKNYFLGSLVSPDGVSDWTPVVVDLSAKKVIYPKSKPW